MGVEKRRSTLSVLFYIKRQTLLKNGEAPVCMRITVDKRKAEIVNYIRSYCRIEDSGINIRNRIQAGLFNRGKFAIRK